MGLDNLDQLDPNIALRKSWILYRYNTCKRSFYWTLKLTKPEDTAKVSTDVEDAENTRNPRDIGIIFHDVAAKGWDNVTIEGMERDPEGTLRRAFNHDNKFVDDRLLNFCEVELKRWSLLTKKEWFIPYIREKYFISTKLRRFGTIDRIDRIGEEEFIVIDYKTGKNKTETENILELAWYAGILNDGLLPGKVVAGVMLFPHVWELNNFVFYHKFEDRDFYDVDELIAQVRSDMLMGKLERTTDVKMCRRCAYYGHECVGPRRV